MIPLVVPQVIPQVVLLMTHQVIPQVVPRVNGVRDVFDSQMYSDSVLWCSIPAVCEHCVNYATL